MGKGDNLQGGVSTIPGETVGTSNPSQPYEEEKILLQNVEVDAEKVKPAADCEDRSASECCGNGKGCGQSTDVLLELESQDCVGKNVRNSTGCLKQWLCEHKSWIIIIGAIILTGASVGIYFLAKPPETSGWTKCCTKPPEARGLQSGTMSPPEPIDFPCGGDLVLTRGEDGEVNRTTLYADHKLRRPVLVRECGIRLNNSRLTVDLPARCSGILTCLGQSKFCYESKGGYIKNITCSRRP